MKATDKLPSSSKSNDIPFRLDRSDLVHWLDERFPVILVLYDARHESAYWLDIKDYFRKVHGFNLFAVGKTITVFIPRVNAFDSDAVRQLTAVKNRERSEQV